MQFIDFRDYTYVMKKVLVLGSSGMLGSTVVKVFTKMNFIVTESNRDGIPIVAGNNCRRLDVNNQEIEAFFQEHSDYDFVVNCVGLIKQKIVEGSPDDVFDSIKINAILPLRLDDASSRFKFRLIQIGTDCVFSGRKGFYTEDDEKDPIDVYGYSKALGECGLKNTMILRCSIIGRELRSKFSLLEWVLGLPTNARVNGFSNHLWNGITTLQFAKICAGVIQKEIFESGIFHVVPEAYVSKLDLIRLIAKYFHRTDLNIESYLDEDGINRTLRTLSGSKLEVLWKSAGYSEIPSVEGMIKEYSQWLNA